MRAYVGHSESSRIHSPSVSDSTDEEKMGTIPRSPAMAAIRGRRREEEKERRGGRVCRRSSNIARRSRHRSKNLTRWRRNGVVIAKPHDAVTTDAICGSGRTSVSVGSEGENTDRYQGRIRRIVPDGLSMDEISKGWPDECHDSTTAPVVVWSAHGRHNNEPQHCPTYQPISSRTRAAPRRSTSRTPRLMSVP